MDNTKSNMSFLELMFFDVLLILIFGCFLVTALFFSSENLVMMLLAFIFGSVTLPYAVTFGKWLTYLRYHERQVLAARFSMENAAAQWIVMDLGIKGHTWMFRLMSGITLAFSIYSLIKYITG